MSATTTTNATDAPMRVETGNSRQIFRGTLRRIEAVELAAADAWARYEALRDLRPATTEERIIASDKACEAIRRYTLLGRRKIALRREFAAVMERKRQESRDKSQEERRTA